MSIQQTTKKLFQTYPMLRLGVQKVQQEIFGYVPQMGIRTGHQKAKKALTGVYLNRYYLDFMDKSARKVEPGYMTELQERRQIKKDFRRRKGKGPPKKGAGSRQKKK